MKYSMLLLQMAMVSYIKERSKVSALHKLPTRSELLIYGLKLPVSDNLNDCIDILVKNKKVFSDGVYFSTKKLEKYPL